MRLHVADRGIRAVVDTFDIDAEKAIEISFAGGFHRSYVRDARIIHKNVQALLPREFVEDGTGARLIGNVAGAGLGIAADANSESPDAAAKSLGVQGLVSNSISSAAESPNRWYALLIGVPVLIWATRSVLRVLIGAHRLVWTDDRSRAPKPKLIASLRLLALLVCFGVVSAAASAVRAWAPGPGLLVTLVALVFYSGLWLLVTLRLPHRETDWATLVPGALVFGIGVEALHVVVAYFITPYAIAKQGTYGALGVAAALLFGLFLVSRLVVAAAVVNATLSERNARSARGG